MINIVMIAISTSIINKFFLDSDKPKGQAMAPDPTVILTTMP